ncbi:hypothetical protein GCM10022252_40880 [Streptosporangium oxazolinicum]|uniref:Uncharacterized protein n=1 Tax=Streptosporangium oxazolinicum TaxID=909287 RepID=A0ABP8B116_9ACTN
MKVELLARPKTADEAMGILGRYAKKITEYPNIPYHGAIFTIGATHTGDMYDVALAHDIMGSSLVVIWGVDKNSVFKAAEIARYVNDARNVFWTDQPPPADEVFARTTIPVMQQLMNHQIEPRAYWIKEGGATTIVSLFAEAGRAKEIAERVAPEVFVGDSPQSQDAAILADLAAHGFVRGQPYVIVNFRQSGHSGIGNAPALDTGVEGFSGLMRIASELGAQPVPMGEYNPFGTAGGATLFEYWKWGSVNGLGRRAEARLLRVLVETHKVVGAVGMRSGVTDLLRYVGAPTLAIDIHPLRGTLAKGWQRTLKRERNLTRYRVVSLLQEREQETMTQSNWRGTFGASDLVAVTKALGALVHDREAPMDQHPTSTRGVRERSRTLLEDIQRMQQLIEKAQSESPTPIQAPGGRKLTAMEEIMLENEARKAGGTAMGQVAQYEIALNQIRETVEHTIEWLTDSYIRQSEDIQTALQDLYEARRLLR